MAGMIEAKDARAKLGCDEATLQNYVNSGSIRAQRVGGKLMLNADDVNKLAAEKGVPGDDEGTIVLTGDSDDLSIDLGKVVDDSAETIVQAKGADKPADSITFGDELEVVSFDDNQNTSELSFDDTKQTGQAGNLSFTDSNTAVMTAVDETAVGGTTAPVEFQTQADDGGRRGQAMSSRRSVRSQRAQAEAAPVSVLWPVIAGVTVALCILLIAPYYVMGLVPRGEDRYASNNDRILGADDGLYANMAAGAAGFSVEPDPKKFERLNPGAAHVGIDTVDPQAKSRYQQYLANLDEKAREEEIEKRLDAFVVDKILEDGKSVQTKGNATFRVVERQTPVAGSDPVVEQQVEVWKP